VEVTLEAVIFLYNRKQSICWPCYTNWWKET